MLPGQFAFGIADHEVAVAVTRLHDRQGNRRIGFIRGLKGHPASETQYLGYLVGLAEAGNTSDPGLVTRGGFVFKEALPAANALLDLVDPPTAIFVAAVISVAHRRHLTIAGDLAHADYRPEPAAQLGVKILFKALRAGEKSLPSSKILFDFKLMERETTGKLKS